MAQAAFRQNGQRDFPVFGDHTTARTANLPDVTVNFREPLRAGGSMEPIDILRDQVLQGPGEQDSAASWQSIRAASCTIPRPVVGPAQRLLVSRGLLRESLAITRPPRERSVRRYPQKFQLP